MQKSHIKFHKTTQIPLKPNKKSHKNPTKSSTKIPQEIPQNSKKKNCTNPIKLYKKSHPYKISHKALPKNCKNPIKTHKNCTDLMKTLQKTPQKIAEIP